jgi:hypothetical protein
MNNATKPIPSPNNPLKIVKTIIPAKQAKSLPIAKDCSKNIIYGTTWVFSALI